MDAGSTFLLIAIAVLAGLFISQPFNAPRRRPPAQDAAPERAALQAEQRRILQAIRELEADAGLEKVDAAEYAAQRAWLLQQGAQVLRRLDELPPAPPAPGALSDDEIETRLAARRAARHARNCPQCGAPFAPEAAFCARCGARLKP